MSETLTIIGILETLPEDVASDLRREAIRTGKGVEELMREALLVLARQINADQKAA